MPGAAPAGHSFSSVNPLSMAPGGLAPANVDSRAISPLVQPENSLAGLAEAYLGLVGQEASALETNTGPVRSLAPPAESGRFGQFMTAGEQATRQKEYGRAAEQFELANDIDRHSPEALLSLAHARFALSYNSYRRAAYYLQQAIRYLPELPLVRLDTKALFAGPDELHTELLPRLTEHLDQDPHDADGYLLLGYFLWFDGNAPAAQDALAMARQIASQQTAAAAGSPQSQAQEDDGLSPHRQMIEAVDTFWDAVKAGGQATGELAPNNQLRQQRILAGGLSGAGAAGPKP